MKKVFKILLIMLLSLIGIILLALGFIWINSSGCLVPLKDAQGNLIEGAVAEKVWIDANGIKHGMFIRTENPRNPVILFLHGGPGSPEFAIIEPYEKVERLEKYFTVCYWEQRGAGMTFTADIDPASATLQQFVDDAHTITEYLRERFGQQKIYLMGHSWGSYLGVKVIEKHPDDYLAYIGIGQVTNQVLSEQLAYDYMLEHARKTGDKKAIVELEKFDKNAPDFPTISYTMGVRSTYMNKYRIGAMHQTESSIAEMAWNVLMFDGYTFAEKIKYIHGMSFSQQNLWHNVVEDNLFESSVVFQTPVYVAHGLYDYQVSYTLAERWLNTIDAPRKAFFTFDNSAHSPNMEEPEKFVQVVRKITAESLNDDLLELND